MIVDNAHFDPPTRISTRGFSLLTDSYPQTRETPLVRPFYANPKFGNTFRDFVQIT